jgi:hypothetical protein
LNIVILSSQKRSMETSSDRNKSRTIAQGFPASPRTVSVTRGSEWLSACDLSDDDRGLLSQMLGRLPVARQVAEDG